MPEQEPQVGQAERSMVVTSSSVELVVGGGDHGVDQVDGDLLALESPPCRPPSARRTRTRRGC